MIIRGSLKSYSAKPTAADAYCVVEVADSSYERDAGEKLYGYAKTGVPQYVIINLRDRTAEVHERPDTVIGTYKSSLFVGESDDLTLRTGVDDSSKIALSTLLP